jgi:hypothetical protein
VASRSTVQRRRLRPSPTCPTERLVLLRFLLRSEFPTDGGHAELAPVPMHATRSCRIRLLGTQATEFGRPAEADSVIATLPRRAVVPETAPCRWTRFRAPGSDSLRHTTHARWRGDILHAGAVGRRHAAVGLRGSVGFLAAAATDSNFHCPPGVHLLSNRTLFQVLATGGKGDGAGDYVKEGVAAFRVQSPP